MSEIVVTPGNAAGLFGTLSKVGRHEAPAFHGAADHDIRIFYPDWQVGYLGWVADESADGGGYFDLYDSKGTESGETDEAWCETCGAQFDPVEVGI